MRLARTGLTDGTRLIARETVAAETLAVLRFLEESFFLFTLALQLSHTH